MATYDPQKVKLVINNITVVGYAPGTFIKAMRNEDGYTLQTGADGFGCRSKNANKSGRFEITLQAASPTNDALSVMAALDEASGAGVGPSILRDISGGSATKASAQNSWVVKQPDIERAKETGEVTWTIETDVLELYTGGIPPLPF